MNSEKHHDGLDSSSGRAVEMRVAAAAEVEQIAGEKLRSPGYDLAVQRRRDGLARLLVKIRRGEAGSDLVKKFLRENNGLPPETEV